MSRPTRNQLDDLRGAAAALVDATKNVTSVVQNVHNAIGAVPVVSDVVYASVRGVTSVVGFTIDAVTGRLQPLLGASAPSAQKEAVLAAVNGVVGDYLAATNNPLAIPMLLRFPLGERGDTLLLLVHGSCMNDLQWTTTSGHDHGRALARDLGFTPAYLHYNSGLHTSVNGRALAQLLEKESARFNDVVIVAHSMGGLVSRSAIRIGEDEGHAWRCKLRALVTLGTPHHGAPLERGGNQLETLVGVTPWTAPLAVLGRMRSAGVTDLRHGNVVDGDWLQRDRFAFTRDDPRTPTPLPEGVRCFAIAGTNSREGDVETLSSDNLVPVKSALGAHDERRFALRFTHARVMMATNHTELLASGDVFAQLIEWLRASSEEP